MCGIDETSDHICFHCHVARAICFSFKEALGWDRSPQNIQDVFEYWTLLGGKYYHIKLFMFSVMLWGLWTVRNKMGIEKNFSCSIKSFLF